jgi:D-alanyl-D-alanine carboxypeptidase
MVVATVLAAGTAMAVVDDAQRSSAGRDAAIDRALEELVSMASGGIVSTPADLNDFIRGYVGGDLLDLRIRAQQRRILESGRSDPIGPGRNSAGLGIFRYATRCGTVWGHTGSFPGYTQFMAASPDGTRSVVVSVNEQLTPKEGAPEVFPALRATERRAVCAALSAD